MTLSSRESAIALPSRESTMTLPSRESTMALPSRESLDVQTEYFPKLGVHALDCDLLHQSLS